MRAIPQKSERIAQAVKAIMDATEGWVRGNILTHEQIESVGELVRYQGSWGTVILTLKKRFETERGITLDNIPGVGYKLATVNEQINDCVQKRSRRAVRQFNKAAGHLEAVPDEEMTTHQQIVRAKRLDGHRQAMQKIRQMRRIGNILMKPTGDNPTAETNTPEES